MNQKLVFARNPSANGARMILMNAARRPEAYTLGWHMASASRFVREARAASPSGRGKLAALLFVQCRMQTLPAPWGAALSLLLDQPEGHVEGEARAPCNWVNTRWANSIPHPLYYTTQKTGVDLELMLETRSALRSEVSRRGFVPGNVVG